MNKIVYFRRFGTRPSSGKQAITYNKEKIDEIVILIPDYQNAQQPTHQPTKPVSKIIEQASDSTHTCRVCYDPFNDKTKLARVLMCGHTFCTHCLQKMLDVKKNFFPKCPECRKLTRQDVKALPTNFQLMQLVRKLNLTGPEEAAESANPTNPNANQVVGELSIGTLTQDSPIEEFATNLKFCVTLLGAKLAEEMARRRGSNPKDLLDCMTKIRSIEQIVDEVESTFNRVTENNTEVGGADDYWVDYDEEDDDYSEEESPSYISGHDYFDRVEMADLFEDMQIAAERQVEARARAPSPPTYRATFGYPYFIPNVNNRGQRVLLCTVCECHVPYGSEASHSNGRRHVTNSMRSNSIPDPTRSALRNSNNSPVFRNIPTFRTSAHMPVVSPDQWQRQRRHHTAFGAASFNFEQEF